MHTLSEFELLNIIKALDNADRQQHELEVSDTNQYEVHVDHDRIDIRMRNGADQIPVVQVISPVVLLVNGIERTGKVTISADDDLKWRIHEEPLFDIQVSGDQFEAYFILKAKHSYANEIMITPQQQEVWIEAVNLYDSITHTLTLQAVSEELIRMNIVKNLDLSAINEELQRPTYQPILVAHGLHPVKAKDAELETYFDHHISHQFEEVEGAIDFRSHLKIPTVQAGDVIAKKINAVEGIHGYDVYGNIVESNQPKDIVIIAKKDIQVNPSGEIIALKNGRPRLTGERIVTVDIVDSFIVTGDVNLETGNVVFNGDVVVYGDVLDNMIIESLGNVYVSGSVYKSTITATGSIVVKNNVIGGQLNSGYYGVIFNRLHACSKQLVHLLDQLLSAAQTMKSLLVQKQQAVSVYQIITLLVESKFKEIPALTGEMMSLIQEAIKHYNHEELITVSDAVKPFASLAAMRSIHSIGTIQGVIHVLQETMKSTEELQESQVAIDIGHAHLTTIKSNGDVMIRHEGVLQCKIYAANHVLFMNPRAVCRGSLVEAGNAVSAAHVGSQASHRTIIKAGNRFTADSLENTKVAIGRRWMDIDMKQLNVNFTAEHCR